MDIVLNPQSGSGAADKVRAEVESLFRAAGRPVRIHPPDPARLSSLLALDSSDPDQVIVAAGGDGTISAVASVLAGSGRILGVLPLGTLNHFAKDLGIPPTLEQAVKVVLEGRTVDVDVGEVNGRVFVNNSSLGLYPHLVASREAQQEWLGRGKWAALAWAFVQVLHRYPTVGLRISTDATAVVRRTPFLFIGNNEYKLAGLDLGARASLQRGKLGIYTTHSVGRLGLLRLFLHALRGRLDQAAEFDAFTSDEVWVESRRRGLLVAADGEVTRMPPPLHYRIRPGALRVRVPALPAGR